MFFCNCSNNKECANIDNLIVHERTYSSDSSKYIIRYSFDQGAFGSCCNRISILGTSDSLCVLERFNIPAIYNNPTWIGENMLSVEVQMLQLMRAKGNFDPAFPDLSIDSINGVVLQKKFFNLITGKDKKSISFSKPSPDGKYQLILYEYEPNEQIDDSVLHISVVPTGEDIPLYGNFYILSSRMYDQIDYVEWLAKDIVEIKVKNEDRNLGQMYFYKIDTTASYPEVHKEIKSKIVY